MHPATPTRRHAIQRAAAAVVRLSGQPIHHEASRDRSHIVNDVNGHCDRQAWAAVFALEELADRLALGAVARDVDAVSAGGHVAGEIDPLDIACEECDAAAGEDCRPLCIGAWQHRGDLAAGA